MNLTNQATVNFTMINADGSTQPIQQQSNISSIKVAPVVKNNYTLTPYIRTTPTQPATTQQNNNSNLWLLVLLLLRIYF